VELTPFEDEMAGVALGLLDEEGPESIPGHYVDGLRHMFNYPELSEGPWPKHVANLLESEPLIKSFVDDMPDVGAVRISIGAENKTTLLLPFTVVFSTYGVPSGASGVVGIVGPTRLEYASAISNVRYLASVMSEMVEGVQGKVS
jgi:heat-inducible transcriptional repressor